MKSVLKSLYNAIPLKKQAFKLVKLFGTPPERIYRHLHFKGVFRVGIDSSYSFLVRHHGFRIENEIFWEGLQGGWEKVSFQLWTKLCARANVIFDIGANTGIYSLIAKAVNPGAKVYAFEPVPRVFEKLEDNCRINSFDVVCVRKAVSNNDGRAIIYDTNAEHILSVTVNRNLNAETTPVVPIEIDTLKLSSFISRNDPGRIDLVKIDVETHEPEVLEGMEEYLDMHRPVMLIEILSDDIARRVQEIVKGKGYLFFNIDERKGVQRVETLRKSDYYNYLFCDRATADALGLP